MTRIGDRVSGLIRGIREIRGERPSGNVAVVLWEIPSMKSNPILEEVWRIKDELAREAGIPEQIWICPSAPALPPPRGIPEPWSIGGTVRSAWAFTCPWEGLWPDGWSRYTWRRSSYGLNMWLFDAALAERRAVITGEPYGIGSDQWFRTENDIAQPALTPLLADSTGTRTASRPPSGLGCLLPIDCCPFRANRALPALSACWGRWNPRLHHLGQFALGTIVGHWVGYVQANAFQVRFGNPEPIGRVC